MKVHQWWLKLALVTIVLRLKSANTQVYTMPSDLEEDSTSGLDTGKNRTDMKTPTSAAKSLQMRTDAPPETDETPAKAPHTSTLLETESAPRPTTSKPNDTSPENSDSELRLRRQRPLNWDTFLGSKGEEATAGFGTSGEESTAESGKTRRTTETKEKKKLVHAAGDDSDFDEAGSLSSRTPEAKKKSLDLTSGPGTASPPKSSSKFVRPTKQESTLESNEIEKQETPSVIQDTDAMEDVPTTEASASDFGSSSGASVLAESASADLGSMSNTVMLGLMMGIAVALGMIVAVFVYVKTKEEEDDDKISPVLWTARQDENKETVQLPTVTSHFHTKNISLMDYNDDNCYSNNEHHDYQYVHNVLTPRSQIVLAQSQMSLPPMAQSGQSNISSQYSSFATQSDFYGSSGYSAASSSVSQAAKNYPRMRRKKGNDSGSEAESDYDGDDVEDMSHAANKWNSANRRGPAASGIDRSMANSRFEPSGSRSTWASDYNGKNCFKDSDYTDGYESRYADEQRFGSSGYSEYAAPPHSRDRLHFIETKESRFMDASYK
ncbi:unnamed protein product [Peronospora destructor]|uniref:Uncharacterized protein n=1 Tax=Peronospora destructor TaxID=86335 RepID=A0AAV0UG81_9STRA|nr:unnamed protein product [Peronospora destructor]